MSFVGHSVKLSLTKKLFNSDAQIRPIIMRPRPAITLEFIPLFWQLQGKRRNSTSATQGESSTFSITRVFLGMNLNLVLRTKRFNTIHYSTVLLLKSDVLFHFQL